MARVGRKVGRELGRELGQELGQERRRGPVALDVLDYVGMSAATVSRSVLSALYGGPGAQAAEGYADRVSALGLGAAPAMQALASILPGTEIAGHLVNPILVDEQAPVISASAKQALLAASDGSLSARIDRLVKARPERVAEVVSLGRLLCTVHQGVSAQDYMNPQAGVDWRNGVTSAAEDIVCVVAARTLDAGLLLGPGVYFYGRTIDATSDELPQGWVMHGPGRTLTPGRYRLEMDIGLGSRDELTFDIVSQRGLQKLANLDLCGSTKMTLGFTVGQSDRELEVRLVNLGGAPVVSSIRTLVIRRG